MPLTLLGILAALLPYVVSGFSRTVIGYPPTTTVRLKADTTNEKIALPGPA